MRFFTADGRKSLLAALGVALGTSVVSLPSLAAAPPKKIDPDAPCVSSECHASYGQVAVPHGDPETFVRDCIDCHEPDEDDVHIFSLEDPPELCNTCHDDIGVGEIVHDPAEEDCLECHDPHGSDVKALLESEDLRELCFGCHDEELVSHDFAHEPAREGRCTGCHDPHASDHESLLRATGSKLCLGCHEKLSEKMESAETVHDPAEDDCLDCHDPHSTDTPRMLLADDVKSLCEECHDDIVEIANDSSTHHGAALEGKQCVNCHSPHAADEEPLLRQPINELCLDCHDRRLDAPDRRLVDLKGRLEENPIWHEPLRKDGCTACHQPHGGDNFRLLAEAFPARFYAPFDPDRYALCFSCHDPKAMTTARTRSATGFRDGARNLHSLHVNRQEKGRTCRACHDPHATRGPLQVADSVRFGAWLMPIGFEKTPTGGSCQPGCHPAQGYDREKAVAP